MIKELDLSKMSRILVVNASSGPGKLAGQVMWGAWAVASYFKTAVKDADVRYLDENNEDDFRGKFEAAVSDRDTVGFSVTSMQIKYTLPLIKYVKEKFPHIRVLVGGAHPMLFPEQDYGPLVDAVISEELPKDKFLYEFLPERVRQAYRTERAQVITGFNCSFKCTFCVNSVRNCRYEPLPIEKICADIDYVVKEFSPKKIYFRDEDFFFDIEKARGVVAHLLELGGGFRWEATSRVTNFKPDKINDELLQRMVRSGCVQVRFGVESGSQRTLNALRKGQTVAHVKNAVAQCVKYGINASCSFIIGIPGETAEDREETYRLISELHAMGPLVEILGPQVYRPYPGGKLFEEVKKYGLEFPSTFEEWSGFYDTNPTGSVFDASPDYPWLSQEENEFLPKVWEVAHYGLNWSCSVNPVKKAIGLWFKRLHWLPRRFGGPDLWLFMFLRKKLLKAGV
ncbi:MAG: hypothetical protein A2234_03965 [Elusimicrobia bacterium RIFOXYA2_FULL_58_8]|nr:MAG: hypothetical protein A2234_03965 [Elusimicrobia bacterium RIFOXYA2_FULL_58_8]OGS13773.1 MAG: hypothetical protein A2285_04045 [Elusimicrobia bacterium RIFOXYA12_FULL_57_11]